MMITNGGGTALLGALIGAATACAFGRGLPAAVVLSILGAAIGALV